MHLATNIPAKSSLPISQRDCFYPRCTDKKAPLTHIHLSCIIIKTIFEQIYRIHLFKWSLQLIKVASRFCMLGIRSCTYAEQWKETSGLLKPVTNKCYTKAYSHSYMPISPMQTWQFVNLHACQRLNVWSPTREMGKITENWTNEVNLWLEEHFYTLLWCSLIKTKKYFPVFSPFKVIRN